MPHVPAAQVAEVLQDDYLRYDVPGEHRQRLEQAWDAIQAAQAEGHMMRLDCCSDLEVKFRMGQGAPGFHPEFKTIIFGDPRSYDLVSEFPRDSLPVWQRPWVSTQVLEGYPVEYRAFVRDGELLGISNYYPQRPLPRFDHHLERVREYTQRLIGAAKPPFLWHRTPLWILAQKPPVDLAGVHFTADFLVNTDCQVLFLEGGPPHELGAHPCCFLPGETEGIALSDRNLQE